MSKKHWEHINNNIILRGDGFYISYNDAAGSKDMELHQQSVIMDALLGAMLGEEVERQEETALCFDNTFLILNGDFRSEYENLIGKGLDECKKFYAKNKKIHQSVWSTDYADQLSEEE